MYVIFTYVFLLFVLCRVNADSVEANVGIIIRDVE